MNLRRLLTVGLLAFVAVSLAAAIADVAGLTRASDQAAEPLGESVLGEKLVVYYFHTDTRCTTCRIMQSHAHEAVMERVEAGALDWRVVNYQQPNHRHFVTEFDLYSPSVILALYRDGEVARWKNLERIWELEDNRAGFIEYMHDEIASFREAQP